jgi:type IV secretory pathway VirJ component
MELTMSTRPLTLAAACAAVHLACAAAAATPLPERVTVPAFGPITIYRGDAPPQSVVLFLSGDGGWNEGVMDMAGRLRDAGALVVGIDIRAFLRSLEASPRCAYPAGALEELARAVEQREKLPRYLPPILAGYSSGATVAYGAIVAAPPETFSGAMSLGFCPDLALRRPLCEMRGLSARPRAKGVGVDLAPYAASTVPWMVLQGDKDKVCDPPATRVFVEATGAARLFWLPNVGHGFGAASRWVPQFLEAYHALADATPESASPAAPGDPGIAGLSLEEVPAIGTKHSDEMAVLLTGDGGWADIDKSVAAGLAREGIPVVGWSSLSYYWTPRTPQSAAGDLARIVDHYTQAWHRPRVLVVGYSFGADVAPFLVNRVPKATAAHIASVSLLAPSRTAAFEFHVSSWFGGGADPRHPTAPEVARLRPPVTCIRAEDDDESVCGDVHGAVKTQVVGRGHHFSGDYARLVQAIAGR